MLSCARSMLQKSGLESSLPQRSHPSDVKKENYIDLSYALKVDVIKKKHLDVAAHGFRENKHARC
ncbi:hypothetical protein ZEAMMB73_Zm00001d038637 [Zea mays]|uniref:Uncharacterized protein n=1 Tax=Zea mays TaxID=4577 RepID=A0A1D6M7M6_MAIZE|nr:hypothetical protein ZEAMMB73_Zm00001d038637 [Zea mays]